MKDLITKAQLHVLPSFTNCGIKLKLINALFNGRHVVTNESMVEGTNLEMGCHIADNTALMKYQVYRLFQIPFSEEELLRRKSLLSKLFDNDKNANELIKLLFD